MAKPVETLSESDRAALARYLPEPFGAKLRRLARQAEAGNALSRLPWTPPAAWAATTAYLKGDVVANGGSWFVCALQGTSAGSGGPTNISTGVPTVDGTAYWTFLCGARLTEADADAPTVTSGSSAPGGLTNVILPVTYPQMFRSYGATPETERTSLWKLNTLSQSASVKANPVSSIGFISDAPKIGFRISQFSEPVRLIIDGRPYSIGALGGSFSADVWYTVDFTSKSGRKPREYLIEGSKGGLRFGGVYCTTLDQVWAPPTDDDVRAVCISDSIWAGSNKGPWLPGGSTAQHLSHLMGWRDVWNFSTSGTGYIATNGGASYTYGQRIAEALTLDPDVWVFMGSTNDLGETTAAETAAALAAFQAIRAGGSTAPIVVLGLWSINSVNVPAFETALQTALTQFDDDRAFFVPIYGDANGPWISGAWNNAAVPQSINAPIYVSDDNLHPPDIGTAFLATRIARALKTSVFPLL